LDGCQPRYCTCNNASSSRRIARVSVGRDFRPSGESGVRDFVVARLDEASVVQQPREAGPGATHARENPYSPGFSQDVTK
jgi:hypothetical protein